MSKYTFPRLEDKRIPHVKYLFKEVFNKKVTQNYLWAKYDTSYLGAKHLCYLAYHDDEPIAFYGAIPQRFRTRGQEFLAVHTCDSFTMAAYQRQGLHRDLALKSYDLMKEHGVKFVYAFHSENTFHSCKKLGWDEGKRMRGYYLITGAFPMGQMMFKVGLQKSVIHKADRLFHRYQIEKHEFTNSQAGEEGMWHDYQRSFFMYKSYSPNYLLDFIGVKFWIKVAGAAIWVGDVSFGNREHFFQGHHALAKFGKKLGIPKILYQVRVGTPLDAALRTVEPDPGFESWRVGYLAFDESLDMSQLNVNFGDLDTF